jgi:glutamyl-tRNA reductase
MRILVTGASFREAPVEVRERLARGGLEARSLLAPLADGVIGEGLVISTCNRLEIVAVADHPEPAEAALAALMAGAAELGAAGLAPHLHHLRGAAAVEYLFSVASGLESQVLGEAQILGQVKEAYRRAVACRTVGPMVSKLFHKSFQTAKRVRTETEVAAGSVSVASAAVDTAQASLGGLSGRRAVILGAGEMASSAAAHLRARGVGAILVASRSPARASDLAGQVGGEAVPLEGLGAALAGSDLLLTAVGGCSPVLTAEFLAGSIPAGRSLLVLDLGVPRNVEAAAAGLPGLALRNIDDFEALAGRGRASRLKELVKAREIVAEEAAKFGQWLSNLATTPTIKDLVRQAEEARRLELERTVAKAAFSAEQLEAVEAMGRALVRRLLHNPLSFAKGCHGRSDQALNMFRRVFGLDA